MYDLPTSGYGTHIPPLYDGYTDAQTLPYEYPIGTLDQCRETTITHIDGHEVTTPTASTDTWTVTSSSNRIP